MFQDKISLRVNAAYKKIAADHALSYRDKCRRAREAAIQIYRDEELCISENLIKRADFLHSWKKFFYKDKFYTRLYELDLIHTVLENLIGSTGRTGTVSAAIFMQSAVSSASSTLPQHATESAQEVISTHEISPKSQNQMESYSVLTIESQETQEEFFPRT